MSSMKAPQLLFYPVIFVLKNHIVFSDRLFINASNKPLSHFESALTYCALKNTVYTKGK